MWIAGTWKVQDEGRESAWCVLQDIHTLASCGVSHVRHEVIVVSYMPRTPPEVLDVYRAGNPVFCSNGKDVFSILLIYHIAAGDCDVEGWHRSSVLMLQGHIRFQLPPKLMMAGQNFPNFI